MKFKPNPFRSISAFLAAAVICLGSSAFAADVTLITDTYTDAQTYDNGTITGDATLRFACGLYFNGNLSPVQAWNRLTLNTGASISVVGTLSTDISGVSLNGGTLTAGGLNLQNFFYDWGGNYDDGKVSIPRGRSIINGSTIVASQNNANFIQYVPANYAGGHYDDILYLGNDGATIDSAGFDIGVTIRLQDWSGQSGTLTKAGAGTLTLTGANSHTGATTISGGKIAMNHACALPYSAYNTEGSNGSTIGLDVTNGLNSGSLTLGGLAGSVNLNSAITAGYGSVSNLVLNPQSASSGTYSGTIDDGATGMSLTKSGAGTQTLTGSNSYTGVTILAGGILNVATFSNYGVDGGVGNRASGDDNSNTGILFRGGTLQYTGSSAQSTDRAIRLSTDGGGGTIDASGSDPSATLNFTRSAASPNLWENAGTRTLTLTGSNTGDNTFAMPINDWNGVTRINVTKSGDGKWALSGSSDYLGVTDIMAGTLVAANSKALGTGGWDGNTMTWIRDGATLALQGDISLDEHMHLMGNGDGGSGALRSLSGDNTLTMYYSGSSGPGFCFDGNTTVGVDGGTLTVTGFYDDGNNYGLTKVGAGTLSFSNSIYTGSTVVNQGSLNVSASGSLLFRPAGNGSNNSVSGSGIASLSFLGTVSLDLGAADATIGNNWTLFNLSGFSSSTLTPASVTSTTLGSFTEVSAGTWELPVTGAKWVFTETDGKLAYASAANTYANWAATNAPGQTPGQDYDNDGVENGVEYFMGVTTPGFTANPAIVSGTINWPKSTTFDGSYAVQTSPDLSTWTNVPSGSLDLTDPAFVKYSPAPGLGKVFVRISVTPN